jgi:hypothetical protein
VIDDVVWEPNFPSEIMRWEITSTHTDATVSIGSLNGKITYTHTGSSNLVDTITFQGKNTHDIVDTGSAVVTVTLCDQVGCDGVFGSGKILDQCGVCDGNDACVDCNGVPNGSAMLDACGVCGGDGSTCGMAGAGNQISTAGALALAIAGGVILIVGVCIAGIVLYLIFRRPRQNRGSPTTASFQRLPPQGAAVVPVYVRTTPFVQSDVNASGSARRRNVTPVGGGANAQDLSNVHIDV